MKKLSLLIVLAMIVTVGGVYATWNYAETAMQDVTHEFKNLGITDVDTKTVSGSIAVTDTLILKIDDEGNFTPGWDSDVNSSNAGNLQMVFTPNPGANDTTFTYTVTIKNNTYTPDGGQAVGIFEVNGDASAETDEVTILTGTFNYTNGQSELCKAVITFDDIKTKLVPNDDITLPTINDYTNYSAALANVELIVTIVENP